MAPLIRLTWSKDPKGYDLVEKPGNPAGALMGEQLPDTVIIPRSGRQQKFLLSGLTSEVFLRVAETPCEKGAVLRLFEAWGPLSRVPDYPLNFAFSNIRDLAAGVDLVARKRWPELQLIFARQNVGTGKLRMVIDEGRPMMIIEPRSLIRFCWLQLFQAAGAIELRRCERCGVVLPLDLARQRGRKRLVCSTSCRVAKSRAAKKAAGEA